MQHDVVWLWRNIIKVEKDKKWGSMQKVEYEDRKVVRT